MGSNYYKITSSWQGKEIDKINVPHDDSDRKDTFNLDYVDKETNIFVINGWNYEISIKNQFVYKNYKLVSAKGFKDKEIFCNLQIPRGWPCIWRVSNIDFEPTINNAKLNNNIVFIDGFVTVKFTYFSFDKEQGNLNRGDINYLEFDVPFDSVVELQLQDNIKITSKDFVKVQYLQITDSDYDIENFKVNYCGKKLYSRLEIFMNLQIKLITLREN